ncbi:MAG: hypothetical protein ACRD5H_16185, partial [Nitrososphaerales archaeon]
SDKKEHPARPLASGKVAKNHAIVLAVSALAGANIVSLATVGPGGLAVSLTLSAVIIAYDYRLKINAVAGPLAMSAARSLNIILGASPLLLLMSLGATPALTNLPILMLASASIFVYTAGIMTLSRIEVVGASSSQRNMAIATVFGVIASVGVFGYVLHFELEYLLFLSAFAAVIALTFRSYLATGAMASPDSTQKVIRNMVLSIILLDSVIVGGTSGLLYGLTTLLFILPAAVLGKKMYVT